MSFTAPGAPPRACLLDAASLEDGSLDARLGAIAGLGFDRLVVRLAPAVYAAAPGGRDAGPAGLLDAARGAGLTVVAELPPLLLDDDHPIARAEPRAFLPNPATGHFGAVDPRRPETLNDGCLRLARAEPGSAAADWLAGLLAPLADRFDRLLPPPGDVVLGRVLATLQDADPAAAAVSDEIEFLPRLTLTGGALPVEDRRAALASIALEGRGWIMEAGYEDGAVEAVRATNQLLLRNGAAGPVRRLTGPAAPLDVRLSRRGETGLLLVRNRMAERQTCTTETVPAAGLTALTPVSGFDGDEPEAIGAHAVRLFEARPSASVRPKRSRGAQDLKAATDASARVVVDNLDPAVDQGVYAVKRVVGDRLEVQADVVTDGHEQLAAALLVKADDETDWRRYPMEALPNDRFAGSAPLLRLGRHAYVVEAWIDEWGGFVRDFRKKLDAGLDLTLEVREGRALIAAAGSALKPFIAELDATDEADARAALLLRDDLHGAMEAAVTPRFLTRSHVQPVEVEREAARFSSWYELFPRSQTDDKTRPGKLLDVIGALPRVQAMGFDTLYFTPIHPIGRKNRKGPNNTLTPGPDDVGSPYAIGAAEGGHADIHPDLGTLEDFRTLVAAADHGLEIALDFAIQCAPDHPWLTEHPGWFAWRPDGSMKYAENPPKKYQDIVNVDFYAPDAVPGLWQALRDVVLFWASEGVRVFRVDNPHTKPLPFWRWMIAEVKAAYPDVLFLSEAFTRPKPMYQLAKVGFSQSYTYFTWRNTKAELTEYLTQLNGPVREFFRPHFFVNTPDINPYFLQSGTRAAFLIRAALGGTLSGLFGVYAGFELCEFEALPGREEYLDSEKYEVRVRPDRRPGDIVDEITQLNALRRDHPHLQSHLGVTFHNAFNDQILYFSKTAPGHDDRILVAVNLDPHHPQEADFEVPLWEFGLGDGDSVAVEDLLDGHAFRWTGKTQHLRLTPERPYAIWRISKS